MTILGVTNDKKVDYKKKLNLNGKIKINDKSLLSAALVNLNSILENRKVDRPVASSESRVRKTVADELKIPTVAASSNFSLIILTNWNKPFVLFNSWINSLMSFNGGSQYNTEDYDKD